MTYPSVEYGHPPYEAAQTRYKPFRVRAAEVLAIFAVFFFGIGFYGFLGQQESPSNPMYGGLLEGSILATGIDCIIFIVLLVAERKRRR